MKKAFAVVLGFVFILSLGTLASAQQPHRLEDAEHLDRRR